MTKLLLFLLLSLLFASCQRRVAAPAPSKTLQEVNEVKLSPKIIFVNLEITEDSLTQEKAVTLINTIVSDGRLKPQAIADEKPGSIRCTFLSAGGQQLHTMTVSDPLEQTFEYATEEGELQKKTIKLKKGTISLRAPLEAGTKQLLIQQLQDNHQYKNLNTINLIL